MRLSDLVIGASIAVIAASLGVVLHFTFGVPPLLCTLAALSFFVVIVTLQIAAAASRQRARFAETIDDLGQTLSHCMRQIAALSERIDDSQIAANERIDNETAQLQAELALVESAVRELADSVDALASRRVETAPVPRRAESVPPPTMPAPAAPHPAAAAPAPPREQAIATPAPPSPAPPAPLPDPEIGHQPAAELPPEPVVAPIAPDPVPPRETVPPEVQRDVATAIAAGRAEMFLQPIVRLPQRRVEFYQATTRVRAADGAVIPDKLAVAAADAAGVVTDFDRLAVDRAIKVARRLNSRGRNVAILASLQAQSLSDGAAFRHIHASLDRGKDIAERIILSLTRDALSGLGPVEEEALASLVDLGCRFALDAVDDLRFDAGEAARIGFRFMKIEAGLLLQRDRALSSDIHPADLTGLMARHGIAVIATGVASERTVVDMLDYDIAFAEGELFSPPRPVRADVLEERDQPLAAAI